MANMYVICLVFVLTMAVVQCTDLTCSPLCTGGKTCKWTCDKDGHQIADANNAVCTVGDAPCASSGKCKAACVATPVNPTCTPPTCAGGQTCKWTCKKSDHSPIVGAYIAACTSESGLCGSAADSGTCKAACVPPSAGGGGSGTYDQPSNTGSDVKNSPTKSGTGSIENGLSPLILMCGILAKLFLSA